MLYWICLFMVLIPLAAEHRLLLRWRSAVPFRIHVHGTRGKSAVVRELTRILRERGLCVLGKTTGDVPEYLLPDGSVRPVRRIGPANIREHARLLRMASRMNADVVVAEGMALQPETIFISEQILRATHAIITNTRPDHEESMGRGREGVLQTLALLIPSGGMLYTAREVGAAELRKLATDRGAACRIVSSPLQSPAQPLSLARAVAGALPESGAEKAAVGVPPLPKPMTRERSGTEALAFYESDVDGLQVFFADLFSVNDVLSSRILLQHCPLWRNSDLFRVALLSARPDRPLRTSTFMDWLEREPRFDLVMAAGDHALWAVLRAALSARARNSGPPEEPGPGCALAGMTGNAAPARLMGRLAKMALAHGRSGLFVAGLGNAHGYAERWRAVYGDPSCL